MNTDLFNAILAMDSYNRGYGAGINFGPGSDAEGTPIGNVTVFDSMGGAEAVAAGFYAIAYQGVDGSVTISYRGTDDPNPFSLSSDVWNGWGVGAGSPAGTQAALAFQFYDTIAGMNGVTDISLTGHSLGGGLAGANDNSQFLRAAATEKKRA